MPAKNTHRLSLDLYPDDLARLRKLSSMSGASYAETLRRLLYLPQADRRITSVSTWYSLGRFDSAEKALGAFELAYQQGLDGAGKSVQDWMGLNDSEFSTWMKSGSLPGCK